MASKELQLHTPSDDVIKGWQKKLALSNNKLSNFVPFIELYALYTKEDLKKFPNKPKWNDLKENRLKTITLRNDRSGMFGNGEKVELSGIKLGVIESQLKSLNYQGGAGISDLQITKGTKEAFNVRYTLNMLFSDAQLFDTNLEYTTLVKLNTVFLIVYGWSTGSNEFVNAPNQSNNLTFDLESENEGFWKASLARMYKFDFNFDSQGQIEGAFEFFAVHNALFTFLQVGKVAEEVKKLLDDKNSLAEKVPSNVKQIANKLSNKTINTIIESSPNETQTPPAPPTPEASTSTTFTEDAKTGQITSETTTEVIPEKGIKRITTIYYDQETGEEDRTTVSEVPLNSPTTQQQTEPTNTEIPTYYYLGWVFEALKEAINKTQTKNKISFDYKDISGNKVKAIYTDFLSQDENKNTNFDVKTITNVFEIPLSVNGVRNILETHGTSLLDCIKNLLAQSPLNVLNVDLTARLIDNVAEIAVIDADYDGLLDMDKTGRTFNTNQSSFIDVAFGSDNTLAEQVNLSSKMDANAFAVYRLPIPDATGDIDILSKLKDVELDDDLEEFVKTNYPDKNVKEFINKNPKSLLSEFAQMNPDSYVKVITSLLSETDVFGQLLGLYLKRTSIVIHGTVGINAFNIIRLKGLLRGLEGLYNIVQVTDQINSQGFSTSLECSLVKKFNVGNE